MEEGAGILLKIKALLQPRKMQLHRPKPGSGEHLKEEKNTLRQGSVESLSSQFYEKIPHKVQSKFETLKMVAQKQDLIQVGCSEILL